MARPAGAADLRALAADPVDHFVAEESLAPEAMMQVLLTCRDHVGRVSIAAGRPRTLPLVSGVRLDGATLLAARSPAAPMGGALKRGLDVIGAALALVALAPLMAVIAVLVRVQSRGPVLFRQSRVGRHGRIFVMFKFRTMVADAEERRAALLPLSRDPGWLHLRHDPGSRPSVVCFGAPVSTSCRSCGTSSAAT